MESTFGAEGRGEQYHWSSNCGGRKRGNFNQKCTQPVVNGGNYDVICKPSLAHNAIQ